MFQPSEKLSSDLILTVRTIKQLPNGFYTQNTPSRREGFIEVITANISSNHESNA